MSHSEPPSGIIVQGDEAFKLAQAIYNAVTGKTESLSKRYSESFHVTMADLQQLHKKCTQMRAQWDVLGHNEHIVIQHIDDNKSEFSSFERLQIYDKSQTSPTESISCVFDILLRLPNVPKPQPYKVTVRIQSRIASCRKFDKDGLPRPPLFIFRLFGMANIIVEVEYIDYIVARNIISTIDSWVAEIEKSGQPATLRFMQKYSHWIPRITSAFIFIISSVTSLTLAPSMFRGQDSDEVLAKFLLSSAVFVVSATWLARWAGAFAESAIDRVSEISSIVINRGDERLLNEVKQENSSSAIKAAGSLIGVIIQGIFTNLLASLILQYMIH